MLKKQQKNQQEKKERKQRNNTSSDLLYERYIFFLSSSFGCYTLHFFLFKFCILRERECEKKNYDDKIRVPWVSIVIKSYEKCGRFVRNRIDFGSRPLREPKENTKQQAMYKKINVLFFKHDF